MRRSHLESLGKVMLALEERILPRSCATRSASVRELNGRTVAEAVYNNSVVKNRKAKVILIVVKELQKSTRLRRLAII